MTNVTTTIELSLQEIIALHQKGQPQQAQDHYLRRLKTHAKCDETLYLLAVTFCQLQDFSTAVCYFKQAIKRNANCAIYYSGLGNAQRKLGQYELAITQYNHSISHQTNNPVIGP